MVWPPRIEPIGTGTIDPGAPPFTRLERNVPIALLPVRLETRWFGTPNPNELELRVRVYPDAIHLVSSVGIRAFERDETVAYWRTRMENADDAASVSAAWNRLMTATGEARALYLRSTLTPSRGPDGSLVFPDVALDEEMRLPDARGLPDRFVVLGYEQGYRRFAAWGSAVPRTLAVGPGAPDDAARRWQVDFTSAEAVGMAVRIKVERGLAGRLTRIVALGVRDTETANAGASLLAEVIDGHARGQGATLLPVGTATNHTSSARATATPVDTGTTPSAGTDGDRIAIALGLAPDHLRLVGGANARMDQTTRAMHAAAWPATWGYFLEHIVGPSVSPAQREAGRHLFINHVRGHGPFPSLCVGRQPYGILPALSLSRWRSERGEEDPFVRGLGALLPRWHASGSRAARLPASGDPLPALLDALAFQSTSVRWVAREAATPEIASAWWLSGPLASAALGNLLAALRRPIAEELTRFGLFPTIDPVRIDPKVYADEATLLDLPLVTTVPDATHVDYLQALASGRNLDALRRHDIPGANPRTLLYLLLRHATLLVAARTANDLLGVSMSAREELDVRASRGDALWDRFARPVPAFGGHTAKDLVAAERPPAHPIFGELAAHRAALEILALLPVRQLEHLTSEVLDVCSHRLDAWITAIATQRLLASRQTGVIGTYVGALGWVDAPPVPAAPARDGMQVIDPGHGHVHAPSLDHARTAAMLRAGFVARPGSDLAVDLSSRRVQHARWLLSGLRAGRSLSELLGYRIERVLADAVDIADLRAQYPMASPGTDANAARLDGLAAYLAWRDNPPSGRFATAASHVASVVDGLSDLLLAESVHQHVRGNTDRGSVLLEALAAGTVVPDDPDVTRTSLDGESTTYQIVVNLDPTARGWSGDNMCVRASANPLMNAWLASILGDPHTLAVTVRYRAADGSPGEIGRTVADLGLCALDVSALAGDDFVSSQLGALFAAEAPAGATEVAVIAAPRMEDAHLLVRSFRDCLRSARPLSDAGGSGADETLWANDTESALALLDEAAADDTTPSRQRLAAVLGVPVNDAAAARSLGADLAARVRNKPSTQERVLLLAGAVPVGGSPRPTGETDEMLADRVQQTTWFADSGRVRISIASLNLLGHGAAGPPEAAAYRTAPGEVRVVVGGQSADLRGVVIDTWTESRPRREATTGVAFHHDAPRARAPQAILLAVPSDPTAGWSLAALEATVHETIELMVARLARPHEVWGPLLPALYFAENLDDETVSTTLADVAINLVVRD